MELLTNKRKFALIGVIGLVLIVCGLCGYKFLQHEKNQNDRISALQSRVSLLQAENSVPSVTWKDGDYNYLAIGNSITLHQKMTIGGMNVGWRLPN